VFYVGFPLWRLLSLPGLFFAGCESVWLWFCLGLALLLPWVALWSFWCLVVCFALVYAVGFGGGALGAAGRCGRSFWLWWCWGCLIGVWGSLARSLGISQLLACLVSEFLLRFLAKYQQ